MRLCMGCMNQIEDAKRICPYCGFDEESLQQESYYLRPGTIVGGKYIVGKVLQYGGHTISYLGYNAERNRKIVVKEYLPSDFSTRSEGELEVTIYSGDAREQFEQGLTNFLNEANRIEQLGSPEGIAEVYDCIAENDTGYVISEYLEGQTLKEILESGKRYTVEEAKEFVVTILKGLSKVHPLDIVHCDIAPETIMVTTQGEIKLLDFGATRYVTTANSKSLAIILKQGYAPEEQYRSKGVRGPWTDVYAVAAVMYRMITGVVPQESVERALMDELKEPSKLGVKIPEATENALMNALNIYQEERTASAADFLQELMSDTVKRRKVKRRRKETGKFPLWAKGVVAALSCLVLFGAFVLVQMSGKGNEELASSDVILQSMETKTLVEAQAYVQELNQEHGWNLQVTEEYLYTKEASQNGKISAQIGLPESFNFTDFLEHPTEDYGLQVKDTSLTGTITYQVYRNDALYYRELLGLNAYTLSEKIGFSRADKSQFVPKDESGSHNYFDLSEIVTTTGTITAEEIAREENADKELQVEEIQQIVYYAAQFFYWKELDNFVGKTLEELPAYPVYEMENEKNRRQSGEKSLLESGFIDDAYYTFDSIHYKKGYIFEQVVAPGEELDLHTDMDRLQEGILLRAIDEVLSFAGNTGYEVKNKVDWENTEVQWAGSKDPSQKVLSVRIEKRDSGEEVTIFRKTDPLLVTIETKTKPKPTPKPVVKPNNPVQPAQEAGGNTGGDSGEKSNGDSGEKSGGDSGEKKDKEPDYAW